MKFSLGTPRLLAPEFLRQPLCPMEKETIKRVCSMTGIDLGSTIGHPVNPEENGEEGNWGDE